MPEFSMPTEEIEGMCETCPFRLSDLEVTEFTKANFFAGYHTASHIGRLSGVLPLVFGSVLPDYAKEMGLEMSQVSDYETVVAGVKCANNENCTRDQ